MGLRSILSCDFLWYIILRRIAPGLKTLPWHSYLEEDQCQHGNERLWPPSLYQEWGYPNQAHRQHPHTMGNNVCAWFGLNPSGAWVVNAVADPDFSWLFGMPTVQMYGVDMTIEGGVRVGMRHQKQQRLINLFPIFVRVWVLRNTTQRDSIYWYLLHKRWRLAVFYL